MIQTVKTIKDAPSRARAVFLEFGAADPADEASNAVVGAHKSERYSKGAGGTDDPLVLREVACSMWNWAGMAGRLEAVMGMAVGMGLRCVFDLLLGVSMQRQRFGLAGAQAQTHCRLLRRLARSKLTDLIAPGDGALFEKSPAHPSEAASGYCRQSWRVTTASSL